MNELMNFLKELNAIGKLKDVDWCKLEKLIQKIPARTLERWGLAVIVCCFAEPLAEKVIDQYCRYKEAELAMENNYDYAINQKGVAFKNPIVQPVIQAS